MYRKMALLVAMATAVSAAAPVPAPPAPHAWTSAPSIRIRGFAEGLGRADFAVWLQRHPASDARSNTRPSNRADVTAMLNSTSIDFAYADQDGDGRVSARELARLILGPGAMA